MNNIEILKEYVDILDKDVSEITQSEYNVLFSVRNNVELRDVVREIDASYTKEDRLKAVYNYQDQSELKDRNELDKIKEACQKAFGIKLDNIEFKKLKSGIDIIAFYDSRINRKRLIDYSYAKSLVNEFSNIQNNNVNFQSEDFEKNANDIAQNEANKNSKRELDMIDIDRVRVEYNDLINRIPNQDENKVYMMNKLLSESESRNIKYINFENMIGLDKDGNIVETSLNRENKVEIGGAEDYQRNINTIDNSGNTEYSSGNYNNSSTELSNDDGINPTPFDEDEEIEFPDDALTDDSDFKKVVEEEMGKYNIQGDLDEVYAKVEKYASDMSLLEREYEQELISDDYYAFYKTLADEYISTQSLEKVQAKKLSLKESGYIIAIVASIISIIVSIITIYMILK